MDERKMIWDLFFKFYIQVYSSPLRNIFMCKESMNKEKWRQQEKKGILENIKKEDKNTW